MDINFFTMLKAETDTQLKARVLDVAKKVSGDRALEALVMEMTFATGKRVDEIAKRYSIVRVEPVVLIAY